MTLQPTTLIQIHYHDRLGGVRQVMAAYAETFSRAFGPTSPQHWLCHCSETFHYPAMQRCNVPAADYHTFRSVKAYHAAVKHLTSCIEQLLATVTTPFVVVIGHNLNLGKNPALSAAFAAVARRRGGEENCRFFSVMHDFLEEGRVELLAAMQWFSQQGIAIEQELYAATAAVQFIVPRARGSQPFPLECNAPVVALPNPVIANPPPPPPRVLSRLEVLGRLVQLSRNDGHCFDPERKLYLYPSRIMYRKNTPEAILLATTVLGGSLIVGASGHAAADRKLYNRLVRLGQELHLPVVFDPSRLNLSEPCVTGAACNPMPLLYTMVNGVVSTAISEGFGYALHEPWLYGVPVFGRYPQGLMLQQHLKTDHLYTRLPVPVSWVSLLALYTSYRRAYEAAYREPFISEKLFTHHHLHNGCIDFGSLDSRQQIDIVRRVAVSTEYRNELVALLEKPRLGWQGISCVRTIDSGVVETNATVLRAWHEQGFKDAFVKTVVAQPQPPADRHWYQMIVAFYRRPENIKLMTAIKRQSVKKSVAM